jgi:enoyl-CoA hydratase
MALVTTQRHGAAEVITYANPPRGTMTARGTLEMCSAVDAAAADPEVRCIILTGGLPDVFVRHYDVAELAVLSDQISGLAPRPTPTSGGGFAELVDALAAAPKPVIAAINGLCMGGGFEISLACDLRLARKGVPAIGLPETGIGIFPGGGGTERLPRLIGEARALEFILRGCVVDAGEALAIGLVHEVVSDPLARALELAEEFATKPAEGLAVAKRLIRAALDRSVSEALTDARRSFVALLTVPSARAALHAAASADLSGKDLPIPG